MTDKCNNIQCTNGKIYTSGGPDELVKEIGCPDCTAKCKTCGGKGYRYNGFHMVPRSPCPDCNGTMWIARDELCPKCRPRHIELAAEKELNQPLACPKCGKQFPPHFTSALRDHVYHCNAT